MTYKLILDTITCLAAVAAGASAVVALVHYLRHWRDDEVKLALDLEHERTDTDRNGKNIWTGIVRISNVGKTSVTVIGFEFMDKRLSESFEINDQLHPEIFLYEGASEKNYAIVRAKEKGVALPETIAFRCKWAKERNRVNGCITVNTAKACPTR